MKTKEIIERIFKDPSTQYELTEFDNLSKPIHDLISIYPKIVESGREAGKTKYFMKSLVPFASGKEEIHVYSEGGKSNPEEIVRQLWVYKLINVYEYKPEEIELEKSVHFGTEINAKAADIVVYTDSTKQTPKIILEVKKPKRKDGIEQLKSYLNAEGSKAKLLAKMPPVDTVINDDKTVWEYYDNLKFDLILTNPPFAGETPGKALLSHYDLAKPALKRSKDKQPKEERDVLFIERILKWLKPGGRAAIVLPQGKFNNSSLAFIREWILRKARLLAVVGLHGNTFKPHTGTKTSVLFVQKYTDEQLKNIDKIKQTVALNCPDYETIIKELISNSQKSQPAENIDQQDLSENDDISEDKIPEAVLEIVLQDSDLIGALKNRWIDAEIAKRLDYPIFMAVSERGGKNNSGDYEYMHDKNGDLVEFPEKHPQEGQPVINQDLVNYNLTAKELENAAEIPDDQLCIAEAFVRFAQKNNVDFWRVEH